MISGVLLGWPTLRLRGDYLAIVTLGFGEIIRIVGPQRHGRSPAARGHLGHSRARRAAVVGRNDGLRPDRRQAVLLAGAHA